MAQAPPSSAKGGCQWQFIMPLTPAAATPLGKAVGKGVKVIPCGRSCGQFLEPLSGKVYNREGEAPEDADRCPKAVDSDGDDNDPPTHRRRTANGTDSTSGKSLGILASQVPHLPWRLGAKGWRPILEVIKAPSTADRRAAHAAVVTMKAEQRMHGPADDMAAKRKTETTETRFIESLRTTTPYEHGELLPRAAAISAWLAVIDHNSKLAKEDRITVKADTIRNDDSGPALELQNVIGLHAGKVLLDEGKAWLREFVTSMIICHASDAIHHCKPDPTKPRKEWKVTVWPLHVGSVIVKSWKLWIVGLPLDSDTTGLFTSLTTDAEIDEIDDAEARDFEPLLKQGGALSLAKRADPRATQPAASLAALERHLRHKFVSHRDRRINVKPNSKSYEDAIAAGATLRGIPGGAPRQPQSTAAAATGGSGHNGARGGRGGNGHHGNGGRGTNGNNGNNGRATAASATAAGIVPAPVHNDPASAFPGLLTHSAAPSSAAAIPLPPAPAAGSGVPGSAATANNGGSRWRAPTANTGATFAKCMAPGCGNRPPSGSSQYPFCRTHSTGWSWDPTTRTATPVP